MLTLEQFQELLTYEPDSGIFRWIVSRGPVHPGHIAGSVFGGGYVYVCINTHRYMAHRLAWLFVNGSWPTCFIDHINGDRADNRIANLRDVSCSVNTQNQKRPRSDNRSGLLGVSIVASTGKYRAAIKVDGKSIWIGDFNDPYEAHAAYVSEKRKRHVGCTI
ncbi:HNH endonuclease signature motif containing protein [Burkholderia vietnamiensis]|uniref:HNH endonuclease signature motif containing protein n=1 Tax=Burkholderia vietnamiensis TaxID=60552 RepID=UPI0018C4578F|nr:HNH endonuclease signature motif containing protein [Burkholderia vietnamiensis]